MSKQEQIERIAEIALGILRSQSRGNEHAFAFSTRIAVRAVQAFEGETGLRVKEGVRQAVRSQIHWFAN